MARNYCNNCFKQNLLKFLQGADDRCRKETSEINIVDFLHFVAAPPETNLAEQEHEEKSVESTDWSLITLIIVAVNFPMIVVILVVLVYRRKRRRRREEQGTSTPSIDSRTFLVEDASVEMEPEAQEQEQNNRHSTGKQANSVAVTVDVHPPRLGHFRRRGREHCPADRHHGTFHIIITNLLHIARNHLECNLNCSL